MGAFDESPLEIEFKKYEKSVRERSVQLGHLGLVLFIYEFLLLFSYNPNVLAYNGVDAWFKYFQVALPRGTLIISVVLILLWAYFIYCDWIGEWDFFEVQKIRKDIKKNRGNKKYKIPTKQAFKKNVNWHHFAYIFIEGFVYGSLIFVFLKFIIQGLGDIIDPNLTMPLSLDSSIALRDYHTNIFQDFALAFGAGFYEEIIFRWLLFWALAYLANKFNFLKILKVESQDAVIGKSRIYQKSKIQIPKVKFKDSSFWTVVMVASLIYTLSHYLYPFGDVFSIYTILYRLFFGLIMFFIFAKRSAATAVWSHTIYDLWYFLFL